MATVTRYRVLVSDALLAERPWKPVKDFRLISEDGPWPDHPSVTICTFEDANAPAELEGLLIDPTFQRNEDGTITIISRQTVTEASR